MIEYTEDIEELIEDIEQDSEERQLSEKEQYIVNVVEATRGIEEDGLLEFWQNTDDPEEVLKSFDAVGAYDLFDMLQSSQWCQAKTSELTEAESAHLEEIESELALLLNDLPEILQDFFEDEEE